ncbi:hypothetical protein VQ056_10055 [Paenibacillus sp. JTLBN-2024]
MAVRHEQEGPYSLRDLSLELRGTGKIGIIGASGAGKSRSSTCLADFCSRPKGSWQWMDGVWMPRRWGNGES